MNPAARQEIIQDLAASFGQVVDKTPAEDQPAHVLLPSLKLPAQWTPSPARALLRFSEGWPNERPDFFIALNVVDAAGTPPRNNGGNPAAQVLVLGETWRQFSFAFGWPQAPPTPTHALQLWLNRFRDPA